MNRNLTVLCTIVVVSLAGCSQLTGGSTVDRWAKENSAASSKILCSMEVNNEYFFVARSGDDVRLGSRIDMTGYPRTHSFIIAWQFLDERGRSLSTKRPPTAIKSGYVENESKIYAENVDEQTLQPDDSRSMEVSVKIKKCRSSTCSGEASGEGDVGYAVKVCSVSLRT